MEERVLDVEYSEEEYKWIVFASYLVLTYVISLRGNEGFMLELRGLRDQLKMKNQIIA